MIFLNREKWRQICYLISFLEAMIGLAEILLKHTDWDSGDEVKRQFQSEITQARIQLKAGKDMFL